MLKQFNSLKALVDGMQADMEKLDANGTKAAGKRVRKTLQEVKKASQELRLSIMDEIRS
jgi:hypothetical protein